MSDVFTVLDEQHDLVEGMLKEFEQLFNQPAAAPGDRAEELADELISNASQHEAAEEQYFWPAVKEMVPNGESLAEVAIGQESEAKEVLATLDGMDSDDSQFVPLVTKFIGATREHIAYEENQTWPALRAVITPQKAEELGGKIAKAKEKAPTRPHPHTPADPTVLKVAGPVVAAVDKARDAVSGRQN